jgi:hypothetical protein
MGWKNSPAATAGCGATNGNVLAAPAVRTNCERFIVKRTLGRTNVSSLRVEGKRFSLA